MGKLTSIDYVRAVAMLYIVGYWHLFDYVDFSLGQQQPFPSFITSSVLAVFVFISGFLLGGRKNREMTVTQFYKRRLMRVYPLYALALATFFFLGINNGWTSIKAVFALSMFLQPAPLTLWFIAMLMLFYLVTPALLLIGDRLSALTVAVGVAAVLVLGSQVVFGNVDMRVLTYLPSFCLGIYCANQGFNSRTLNWKSGLAFFLIAVPIAGLSLPFDIWREVKHAPLVTIVAYLTVAAVCLNEKHFRESRVVTFISYSSFSAYLFHRPVYTVLTNIYQPQSVALQVVYMLMLCLPMAILAGWSMQRLYDALFETVQERSLTRGRRHVT